MIDPQLLHDDIIDGDNKANDGNTQDNVLPAVPAALVPTLAPTLAPVLAPTFVPAAFVALYRPVTFISNPTQIYNDTFGAYDNQASNIEGRLMSTLHHHLMIVSGLKSHHARKLVQPRLEQHFQETCDDTAIKIPTFNAANARAQDQPLSFFRDRIFNVLANGLVAQYAQPHDVAACTVLHDNCKLEARSWTLEKLDAWDSRYRQEIKDNQGLRTEAQSHMQLPSKEGEEE